jgi:hypothetical protein
MNNALYVQVKKIHVMNNRLHQSEKKTAIIRTIVCIDNQKKANSVESELFKLTFGF